KAYRAETYADGTPAFDYFVGSVHFVNEMQIDGRPEKFAQAVEAFGGLEALVVSYYEAVAEMIEALHPYVVGHLDLIKKNLQHRGCAADAVETPHIQAAVTRTLEVVRDHDGILDLNTAGWRKGLGEPYPTPRLVQQAHQMGIPFCFGDDSHRTAD